MKSSLTVATTMAVVFAVSPFAAGQGVDAISPELPPEGVYIAPREYMRYTGPGLVVILDDPVLHPLVGTTQREDEGPDERETFLAEFQAVVMLDDPAIGPPFAETITMSGPVEMLTQGRADSETGSFPAEIIAMSLSGQVSSGEGLIPVILRESPSIGSAGVTEITDLGGGLYHIDSFFDVFTEMSVDGGNSWIAAETNTRVRLEGASPGPDGVDVGTAELPPDGAYVGPGERAQDTTIGYVLNDPVLHPDVSTTLRTPDGNDEFENFEARLWALETGLNLGRVEFTGPVQVLTQDRLLSTSGTFQTEIVSMSLTGGPTDPPLLIREDPFRASTGVTDITDIGGGLYHIDSFFDVFVEMSVDGGASWSASVSSVRLYLEPMGPPCPEDIDGDGQVGFSDLLRVLSAWGPCP